MNLKNVGSVALLLVAITLSPFSPICYAQDEYPEIVQEIVRWRNFFCRASDVVHFHRRRSDYY